MGGEGTGVLLTIPAVAARLGLARSTVWSWVYARTITSVKVGRCRRIPEREIERLILAGTQSALDQAPPKPLAAAHARLRARGGRG